MATRTDAMKPSDLRHGHNRSHLLAAGATYSRPQAPGNPPASPVL